MRDNEYMFAFKGSLVPNIGRYDPKNGRTENIEPRNAVNSNADRLSLSVAQSHQTARRGRAPSYPTMPHVETGGRYRRRGAVSAGSS